MFSEIKTLSKVGRSIQGWHKLKDYILSRHVESSNDLMKQFQFIWSGSFPLYSSNFIITSNFIGFIVTTQKTSQNKKSFECCWTGKRKDDYIVWCSSILIFLFALNAFKNYFKHFKLAAADFRSSTITSKLGWCSLHKIPWHTISFLDKWAQTVSTKIQAGEHLAFPPVLKESKLHFVLSFKMFYFIVMYRIYSVFYPHYTLHTFEW